MFKDTGGGGENYGGNNDQGNNSPSSFLGRSSKVTLAILTLCSCCLSSICTVIGIVLFTFSISVSAILERIEGEIIGQELCIDAKNKSEDSNRYAAIIEYYDEFNQETYEIVSNHCSEEGPTIGEKVQVFYNPEDPGKGYDDLFLSLWIAPSLLSVFALVGWVCFIFLACKYRQRFLGPSANPDNSIEYAEQTSTELHKAEPSP